MPNEGKTVLAVGAHPDDVEFYMAGTLILLKEAGYEPHVLTIANGSCGTVEHTREEIIGIRKREADNAARSIGAIYHQGFVDDIMIYYEDALLKRVGALVRELNPEIILTHSPQDYMEDHQNSSRLIVTAAFCKGMRNFKTDPETDPVGGDTFIYHALPHGLRDGMRRPVIPGEYVDITDVIDKKEAMLACHESQKKWLDVSQGLDAYLITMRELSAEVAKMCGVTGCKYAEGWRRHLHLGFSAKDFDKLLEVLGSRVIVNEQYEKDLG